MRGRRRKRGGLDKHPITMETELRSNSIRRVGPCSDTYLYQNLCSFPDNEKVPSALKRIFNIIILTKIIFMKNK